MILLRRRGSRWLRRTSKYFPMKIKGKYGCIILTCGNKLTLATSHQVLFKLLTSFKRLNKLCYGIISVVGRGMVYENLKRASISGSYNLRRARKFNHKVCLLGTPRVKTKSKKQKKKKKWTTRMRFRRKWYNRKKLYRCTFTRMGERGHFAFKRTSRTRIVYRKLNTLYKYIAIAGLGHQYLRVIADLDQLGIMKKFGPYKMKGMKRLYEFGLIKEGKIRKY